MLAADAPESIKKLVEAMGGHWLRMLCELSNAVATGKSQAHMVFGMGWWDFLNANPRELEDFGEAMKANSMNSLRGVLHECDFAGVQTIADVGGGFGHLAVALLEMYPELRATESTHTTRPLPCMRSWQFLRSWMHFSSTQSWMMCFMM